MSSEWSASEFEERFQLAFSEARKILDTSRTPCLPGDVPHRYEDKYMLAQSLISTALAASMNALEVIGLQKVGEIKSKLANRSATLLFKATEKCDFIKKETRVEKSKTAHVTQTTMLGNFKSYTETTIDEWFWKYTVSYQIALYFGSDNKNPIVISSRTGHTQLKTLSEHSPRSDIVNRDLMEVDVTYFFQNTDVVINRDLKSCRTPRRNVQSQAALDAFASFASWCDSVHSYFRNQSFPLQTYVEDGVTKAVDLSAMNINSLFNPVASFMEEGGDSPVMLVKEKATFLNHQIKTLQDKKESLSLTYSVNDTLVSHAEATLGVVLLHLVDIARSLALTLHHIEVLLLEQVVQAIGKHVQPKDIIEYMHTHTRKFYLDEYQPNQFCFPIRLEGHVPEGVVSIETVDTTAIETTCSRAACGLEEAMFFYLDAATKLKFTGTRYLHGYLSQTFANEAAPGLVIRARARQFSSYILLIGKIAAKDLFEPTHAVLIQNKDSLLIPLLTETIPSAKAFKEAISSLSPEQQRFAKAFRAMQLESTLFAIAVIQVKPQLEKVLNLPLDSLTKEIELTQDLLKLFQEYQTSADLLSFDKDLIEYDGIDGEVKVPDMIKAVRSNADKVMAMIRKEQDKQIEREKIQQEYERAKIIAPPVPAPVIYASIPMPTMSKLMAGPPSVPMASASMPMPKTRSMPMKKSVAREEECESAAPPPPPPVVQPVVESKSVAEPAPSDNTSKPADPSKDTTKEVSKPTKSKADLKNLMTIPNFIDGQYDTYDTDGAVRPTILKCGSNWNKTFYQGILGKKETTSISSSEAIVAEKTKAFDLLDCLTKSGGISLDNVDLHVVIAATHAFGKTVMETLVQDNDNPIEKIQHSSLILTASIHGVGFKDVVSPAFQENVKLYSPNLV